MKKVTVVLCFVLSLQLYAVNKSTFDIIASENNLAKSGDARSGHFGSKTISNEITSFSMMLGGYFTMGTTAGVSISPFDDACELSFGHPYALTSFPFFSIDGQWTKPDEAVHDLSKLMPSQNGDSLLVQVDVNSTIRFVFHLQPADFGKRIDLTMTVRNIDTKSHHLGLGLMFDPALGQWGDGYLKLNEQIVQKSNEFVGSILVSQFEIWERPQQPFGLRLAIQPTNTIPDKLIVTNWAEVYNNLAPEFLPGFMSDIYDLCLKFIWEEREIQPQAELSCRLSFSLQEPDFSSSVFLRWDMPFALSLENNILFPRHLNTTVRAMNTTRSNLADLNINIQYPEEFDGTDKASVFRVDAQSSAYPNIAVSSKERYEDLVVPITLTCESNSTVLDQFTRQIFIPATPVSDEGLNVSIDSLMTNKYPEVSLVFTAENEETGQRLLNLQSENVFLYENEQRIRDFSMAKHGGGSRLVDVCFVLDCSGSMGDNIAAVRNNLGEFADSLSARGFDFRVAVVTFSTTVDDVWDFTNDIELMKTRLAGVDLWGGIEDSPSALYRASQLSWRPGSKRNIIWVTDEPYPEDNYTQEQIVNRMLTMDIKVHGVGLLELQTDWFNPIVLPTGGTFYDIFGNFRDVLLDVARLKSQDRYLLTFRLGGKTPHLVQLQIHYAGLGGQAYVTINGGGQVLAKKFICYPNPFNPVVKILVDAFAGKQGDVAIYNVRGQCIRHFSLTPQQTSRIVWNAQDEYGVPVSSGFYLVTVSIQDADGQLRQETQKILYLK